MDSGREQVGDKILQLSWLALSMGYYDLSDELRKVAMKHTRIHQRSDDHTGVELQSDGE